LFDSVGRDLDENATKRSLLSLVITLAGLGTGMGGFIATSYLLVKEVAPELLGLEDISMVEILEEDLMDAPPPPPPPPPSSGPEEEEEDVEEPDEMVEEIKELEEKVETEVKNKAAPTPVPGGVEGGVIGGVEGGVIGGTLGGARVFHHSELDVKKRVQPVYPEAAKAMNLGDQRCKVRIFIDETGRPYDVRVEGCPKVFHSAARNAFMKWRWYPPKSGREKVKAQILIGTTFKLRS
jgi:protein TonB